jgi:hypothetical protein
MTMPNSRSGVHRPSRTSDIRLRRDSPPPSARGDTLQSGYQAFYQRLCGVGKAKKVALTACMRKLLIILNAMFKHRPPRRPDLVQCA